MPVRSGGLHKRSQEWTPGSAPQCNGWVLVAVAAAAAAAASAAAHLAEAIRAIDRAIAAGHERDLGRLAAVRAGDLSHLALAASAAVTTAAPAAAVTAAVAIAVA